MFFSFQSKNSTSFFKKGVLLVLCLYYIPLCASSKTSLNSADWQAVLGGNVLTPPKKSSQGFIAATEGNILTSCTEKGVILWQRRLSKYPTSFCTITKDDFIYLVTTTRAKNAEYLCLFNPSGILLWEKKLDEKASGFPLRGFDGRVFIPLENSIACYGLRGSKKWQIQSPKTKFKTLFQLEDGSIIRILKDTKENCSIGIRFSPYGRILENFLFSGIVSCAVQKEKGEILLGFKTGKTGALGIKNQSVSSLWTQQNSYGIPTYFIEGSNSFCTIFSNSNKKTIVCYDTKTNTEKWQTSIPFPFAKTALETAFYNDCYALSYSQSTVGIRENDGKIVWNKSFKIKGREQPFSLITKNNYLILCGTNWTIQGHHLYQNTITKKTNIRPLIFKSYKPFSPPIKNTYYSLQAIYIELLKGNYGIKEASFSAILQSKKMRIYKELDASAAEKDFIFLEKIPKVLAATETAVHQKTLCNMLRRTNDQTIAQAVFSAARIIGYDQNGKILTEIERYLNTHRTTLKKSIIISACDTVAEICYFMGRPLFYTKGKQILASLLNSTDPLIKKHTIETLKKIITLEL